MLTPTSKPFDSIINKVLDKKLIKQITTIYSNTTLHEVIRRTGRMSYQPSIMIMKIYSRKRISTNYLNVDPGIMLLNSLQASNLSTAKPIPCLKTNRVHYMSSSQKTSK